MDALKVLIVDDEPLARELLETYVLKMPGLQLVAKCANALEAFSVLSKHKVDIMLLDINMPEITGIDFLKTLKNPPAVIFTTAYAQFAVESYDLDAVDYLLKPITFERFMKAINKATTLSRPAEDETPVKTVVGNNEILFVKADSKMIKVELADLWFVEGLKNYIRLWTENGKIIVHSTMKNFEDHLSGFPDFIRVNKSYIINIRYINEIDGNVIRIKGEMIPVGNTYKEQIDKVFEKYKLH